MSRQWKLVALIVAGLGLGIVGLVRAGRAITGVEVGNIAPDFELIELATGDTVSLSRLTRGDVTLVNIWATWCAPCLEEMPAMQAVYDSLQGRGFRIAAVSIDQGGPERVRAFVDRLGLTFEILHDPTTRIQQVYQTTGVPESFLLDRDGRIVHRVIGSHDWNSPVNRERIARLLDGAGS